MTDRPIIETRRDQMFPVLAASEIERIRHYGQVRRFNAGDLVTKAGEAGRGLTLILTGEVEIARPNHLGDAHRSSRSALARSSANSRTFGEAPPLWMPSHTALAKLC
jgi:signal-transduction protein with cAMP-binding, CBS, and nucleotidyltransferase domain